MSSPIDRLRALDKDAIPGPWRALCSETGSANGYIMDLVDPDNGIVAELGSMPDMRLAATLRNLAPELLALWEACERRMYAEGQMNRKHGGVVVEDEDYEAFRHAELMEKQALAALNAAAESEFLDAK